MAVTRLKYSIRKGQIAIPSKADYVDARVLAATVSETVTVPSGGQIVVLRGDADFYVNFNSTTGLIPAADIITGGSPIFLASGTPHMYDMGNIAAFGLVAAAATVVTMEFYI